MAEVFNVEGRLGLNVNEFKSKMGVASKNLNSFKMKAKRMAKSVKKSFKGVSVAVGQAASAMKVMALAGVAGVTALVKTQMDYQDALAKSADKIGTNSKALSGLRFAAEQVSGSYKGIDEALTKASKRLGEFNASGGGAAAKWLERLNLDTERLAKLDPAELFNEYSAAISGLPSRGEKLAAASALMGDESRKFLTLMEQGPEAIKAFASEAEQLGIAMTRVDAAKIEAANDAINRVKTAFKGAGATLSVELAPFITAVSDKILGMIKSFDLSADAMMDFVNSGVRGLGFMLDAWHGFGVAMQGVKVIVMGFASAFTGVINGTLSVAAKFGNAIKDFMFTPIKEFMTMMSKLPMVGDKFKEALSGFDDFEFKVPAIATEAFDASVAALVESKEVLKQKLAEPMPSQGLTQWVAEVRVAAEETSALWEAQLVAKNRLSQGFAEDVTKQREAGLAAKQAQLEQLKSMENAANTFGNTMRSTLGSEISGVLNGEFDNIGGAFKVMLKNMVAQAIASKIAGAIGLGGGPAAGGGGAGFFAGAAQFASGFFADGGQPQMNKAAVVGENGPELFIPKQAGTIIPNGMGGGGGGSTTININVSGVQNEGDLRRTSAQVARAAGASIKRAG